LTAITVIGIDCSATKGKTGLARALFVDGELTLTDVQLDRGGREVPEVVIEWLNATGPNLIAVDAPLGWPTLLGSRLGDHAAGAPVAEEADLLFKRYTDLAIQARLPVYPFSVGADRIARTAHAALQMLGRVAHQRGAVPLAWKASDVLTTHVIEVYPTATRNALGDEEAERRERRVAGSRLPLSSPHERDACTCLIAAQDFLNDRAVPPQKHELLKAMKEGWIWAAEAGADSR
jgi:predicted RNase H-like nuclease